MPGSVINGEGKKRDFYGDYLFIYLFIYLLLSFLLYLFLSLLFSHYNRHDLFL